MATTTISITEDAYKLLSALKREGESFSDVIKRNVRVPANTSGELLDRLTEDEPPVADLSRLQRNRRSKRS